MAGYESSVCSLTDSELEGAESTSEHILYEKQTLKVLQRFETEFRNYYKLYRAEVAAQEKLLAKLRELSVQYTSNANTQNCTLESRYMILPQAMVAESYSESYEELTASNERCTKALDVVRKVYLKFCEMTSQLDMQLQTPFILGDVFHQPIAYFIQLVQDVFKYMHNKNLQLDYLCGNFDPMDLDILQTYLVALQPNSDFDEHLLMQLRYCNCKEAHPMCEPEPHPVAFSDSRPLTVLYRKQAQKRKPPNRAKHLRRAYRDLQNIYMQLNQHLAD